ncbi:tyrosine-type recombinase/integrase [Streptomyces chartreusis]|uniref:tyrosine-type recombinase/integrase n=1 Tax=Streptomyces chartreusis TaxID=1969 RepID=UPI00123D36F2|nr:site-specific integrase [Streptomyces chartreusis]QEV66287.1 site-specific integrase [Streptomyces chartreusis]GGW99255.1 hypothetical protein GCM10010321_12220 [Streptomyces chartreusis]
MAGYVEDRWLTKKPDPATGKRRETARHGKGKRWRVAGVPGVKDRSFTTEAAAKKWLKESATDSERGTFYDPRDGEMLLQEYVEKHWWPNLRRAPTTKQSMRPRVFNHILPHVGHLPLNRIGHDEVKAWQTRAEEDIDTGTLVVTWRNFSSIMQAAHKAKRIPVNPFRDPDLVAPTVPKSKAKAWSDATLAAVRAELATRYQMLADLGFTSGLRQGEAFGVSPDDVDGDVLRVVRQIINVNGRLAFGPPKGNKEREAPCPPELARAIKEYADTFPPVEVTLPWVDPDRPNLAWEARPSRTVRLLVTTGHTGKVRGGAVSRDMFNELHWKPALAAAGVIPASTEKSGRRVKYRMPREDGFHVLRHTFASVVLAEGETIGQLAAWLGHADPAFTLRTYVHFMPKSGIKAVAALGGMLSRVASAADAGGTPENL